MKRLSSAMATILLATASSGANAAVTDYVFDSISKADFHNNRMTIVGILRNTATPIALTLSDQTNSDNRMRDRCVPIVLTMLEKPGKYYLNVTGDPDIAAGAAILKCGLEVRT